MNNYNPVDRRNKPVIPNRTQVSHLDTEKPFSLELLIVVEALAEYGKTILDARTKENAGDVAKTDEKRPFAACGTAVQETLTKGKKIPRGDHVNINC